MIGLEIRAVDAVREPDVRVMPEGIITAHTAAPQFLEGCIAAIHALKAT
jgi:hypothetical protein